jgi:hypothetical protein
MTDNQILELIYGGIFLIFFLFLVSLPWLITYHRNIGEYFTNLFEFDYDSSKIILGKYYTNGEDNVKIINI